MSATDHHDSYSQLSGASFHAVALAVVAISGLYGWQQGIPGGLISSLYLFVYVHMIFSIGRKHMTGSVAFTWLLVVFALVVSETASFLGYILPTGQFAFQVAAMPTIGPYVGRFISNMDVIGLNYDAAGSLFLLGIVGLNIGARFKLHANGHRLNERMLALGALWVLIILVATSLFSRANVDEATALGAPLQIVPDWFLLPFYAVLRAIPSKEGGIALMFLFLAIPVLAIFIGSARSKGSGFFISTMQLCALFSFIGLGYLGAQSAELNVLLASRVLTAVYIFYFVFAALFTRKPMPA